MTTLAVGDRLNNVWVATTMCCVGVVIAGLSLETSIISLSIAAMLCIGLLCYLALSGSRIKAIKVLLLNSGLLTLIFVLLRMILIGSRFPHKFWPWLPRIFRVWSLSEYSAILLALFGLGYIAIEVVGKIGSETTRKRFQRCLIAATASLGVVNISNFLRPVGCADCFFPYGLPFTFFTEGGFAGGGGVVWLGLMADAAMIAAFAAICTLVWNRVARS